MAEEITKVLAQLHDDENNIDIYPATLAKGVTNANGDTLENVEAGAQVNIIECVEFDGTELVPVNKKITIPGYTFVKESVAEEGMAATYRLYKGNTPVGDALNIGKDMFLQSGSCKICETKDTPQAGFNVGDWYLDLVLANATNDHIYINLKGLIDTYTQGTGIIISNNEVSIDDTVVVTHAQLEAKNFITYNVLETIDGSST